MLSVTITDRPEACITLTEAKAWLRVDHTADDTLLTDVLIPAAQDIIEQATGLMLSADTVVVAKWDAESNPSGVLDLPLAPFDYMVELTVNGEVVPEGDYTVNGLQNYPVLETGSGVTVIAEYIAGYAAGTGYDVSKLPPALKLAVLNQLAYMYDKREANDIADTAMKTVKLYTRNLPI
jgi:uncharacterized phiE125 gp8 family phage protein